MTDWPVLLDSAVRASLIVAAALVAVQLLRTRPAALRHLVLSIAIVGAIVAPVATRILPSWNPGFSVEWVLPVASMTIVDPPGDALTAESDVSFALRDAQTAEGGGTASAGAWLVRLWIAGTCVFLCFLVVGLVRLSWLARRSRPVTHNVWRSRAADIASQYRLRRPLRILESDHPTLLVTWGLIRPTVILPRAAHTWSGERARIVLAHELAHAARWDWPVQMLAECLRAACWFNPLMWIACRRLRHESEMACDDAVLRTGVDGCDYATHLLDLARMFVPRRSALPALGMARPSGLQRRVQAMVNTQQDHGSPTRLARVVTVLVMMSLIVPVASARRATQPDRVSGLVLDPMLRPIERARVVLTGPSSDESREVRTDAEGRWDLSGLPAGSYRLVVSHAGFKSFRRTVLLDGVRPVQADSTLELGGLAETIHISGRADAADRPRSTAVPSGLEARRVECASQPGGGHIVAPKKVADVQPQYPSHLVSQHVAGTVILEGVVTTTGTVGSLIVVRQAHPDLAAAAIEAVRQWAFTPTLLNCEPVEVLMTVTLTFAVESSR